MFRIIMRSVVALSLITSLAKAGEYDQAPWRASVVVSGDTLNIWVDPGIYDSGRQVFLPWYDSQQIARAACMNCAPNGWGLGEFNTYSWELARREQNPSYLSSLTFCFVNIERRGTATKMLYFRTTLADSVVLIFRDGRRVQSEPPHQIEIASIALQRTGSEKMCRQLQLQLAGQPLWTRLGIEARRTEPAYSEARYNEFTIPFRIKDPPPNLLNQVQGIRVYIVGQVVDLQSDRTRLVGAK